ncbi:MAG: hypothetical protein EOO24_13490 [Comamonadaceae bacterium]|nr:MAG: hypothetical protein EOO24_13490 [Comamonadaceae bacterium]
MTRPRPPFALLLLLLLAGTAQAADDEKQDEPPWKFTVGRYGLSGGGEPASTALDLNLRNTSSLGNAWIGWYGENRDGPHQWRAGWDNKFQAGPVSVQPSVQIASGGFRGGSLYGEVGQDWFAGLGFGRTNLQPYINLNFDPNDMVMLQGGRRWDGNTATVLLVADNRQNPDQRHLHFNWKAERPGKEKLTLDLLAKRGLVDGELIRRIGFSATYDWPRWSLRAAWDPKVNFTARDMVRLSVAAKF